MFSRKNNQDEGVKTFWSGRLPEASQKSATPRQFRHALRGGSKLGRHFSEASSILASLSKEQIENELFTKVFADFYRGQDTPALSNVEAHRLISMIIKNGSFLSVLNEQGLEIELVKDDESSARDGFILVKDKHTGRVREINVEYIGYPGTYLFRTECLLRFPGKTPEQLDPCEKVIPLQDSSVFSYYLNRF